MKFKLLLTAVLITLLLLVLATAVRAQGEPPAPYAGLKNPFLWGDTSAQQAGKGLYQRSCLGCHGANGSNVATADFSTANYPQHLEASPDFYFWVLSEGRLNKGMPPFKSSLAEEQRWQVLTYLWSLGATAPAETTPPPTPPPPGEVSGTLLLAASGPAQPGQSLTLKATVQDSQGKPIGGATVRFFLRVDFFTGGLMEIGEAVTNGQGIAVLEYAPRQTGDTEVVARYQAVETATSITLTGSKEHFHEAEVGLPAPSGQGIFIGPKSALELGEMGKAPETALRIPGGLRGGLLLAYVATVMLVWGLYLRVMYLLRRISLVSEKGDTNIRLVPLIGLAVMTGIVTLLVLILITGPYSHFHLSP